VLRAILFVPLGIPVDALKCTGIQDFRWHDLPHTWASLHAQQRTPMSALQELGGWEAQEMVWRYAHFSPEHLTSYAVRLTTSTAAGTPRRP
jgi:integrase